MAEMRRMLTIGSLRDFTFISLVRASFAFFISKIKTLKIFCATNNHLSVDEERNFVVLTNRKWESRNSFDFLPIIILCYDLLQVI